MSIMPQDPDHKPDTPPRDPQCVCGHPCTEHVPWSQGQDCRRCGCERCVHVPATLASRPAEEDPEEFCSDCFAGMESSEHNEKCVRPAEERNDLRALLTFHLSGRHVKLYGGNQGLLHNESVAEIVEGILRNAD